MANRPDVVIVGGGVIGMTTAYFLARDGISSVVLDQRGLGREASWAGAGIIPPSHSATAQSGFDRLRAKSCDMFPALAIELRERTGIDNGYRRCGGLEFLQAEGEAAAEEWHGVGVREEEWSEQASLAKEPALAPGLGPARHLPDMTQIRNPRHLQALVAACQGLRDADGWPRVELRPGTTAFSLLRTGNHIDGVVTPEGIIEGGQYLVATGAWTAGLLRPLGWSLPIEPVRGQIALLNPGMPILSRVLIWGAQYLVPRLEGRILIGSTEEHVGFDHRATAAGMQNLLDLAIRLVPELARAEVEKTWAGLRPGSRDGLPYLGRLGEFENLFVAAGHFRAGLQLSPGTAMVMKELLLGQPPSLPLADFAPDRHM